MLQTFEPAQRPPPEFRSNTLVGVEFLDPADVGFRCADRGATYWGLPGINAVACATKTLVSLPNPCSVINGGWYADLLCHEIGHTNGWPADHLSGGAADREFEALPPASQSPEALAYSRESRQTQTR
jgi:hypothetical protein